MPRILINEKDRTSPGTSGSYANYSVLIAGFAGRTAAATDEIQPIETTPNGLSVYEFTDITDFEKTIGLVAPDYVCSKIKYPVTGVVNHYGNQMAYELLGLGYSIIYVSLGESSTDETEIVSKLKLLGKDTTWEIFKDRATFDFRFVTHGLLTSGEGINSIVDEQLAIESGWKAAKAALATAKASYDSAVNAYERTLKALEIFNSVDKDKKYNNSTEEEKWAAIAVEEEKYVATENSLWKASELIYFNNKGTKIGKAEVVFNSYDEATKEDTGIVAKVTKVAEAVTKAEEAVNTKETEEAAAYTSYLTKLEEKNADNFIGSDFNNANEVIANLAMYKAAVGNEDEADKASGRGDCIALIEVDESKYVATQGTVEGEIATRPEKLIVNAVNEMTGINADNGKFCAITVPSVFYSMDADPRFDNNVKFPAAFHYLACFKYSLGIGFAEWYAAAGYTRGISSYIIDRTSVKLGEIAINALEPRYTKAGEGQPVKACNVIANFRGSYYLWGNRTAHPVGSFEGGNDLVASHFLNIRHLCTTIKKQLYVACRKFTFDPNSDTLWVNFCNAIRPTLEAMKADQGVRDYKIMKVYTDKKATLKAKIRIIPIEAVEDFVLEVSLEDSFGETTATVTE